MPKDNFSFERRRKEQEKKAKKEEKKKRKAEAGATPTEESPEQSEPGANASGVHKAVPAFEQEKHHSGTAFCSTRPHEFP